jgi:hypothetical protein
MAEKLTWSEPNRPEIPSGWPVLIQGVQGTAYEDTQEFWAAVQIIIAEQAAHPNEPPVE